MRPVRATYRLQLHAGFTFADAAAALPFLAELGVSHVYLSPVVQAAAGSMHGYDVVDVETISSTLGGDAGFDGLAAAAEAAGVGIVVDIVPHHMAIGDRANRWWWEVLIHGEQAPHAAFFDIDWRAPDPRRRSKVVLPVLDDHVGRAIDSGTIRLLPDDDELAVLGVGDHLQLPLSPTTTGEVLGRLAHRLDDDPVLDFVGRALVDVGGDGRSASERVADRREALRLARDRLRVVDPQDASRDELLAELSGDRDALDAILDAQAYRVARWQVASDELDYRRFFDINTLVALRTTDPSVFAATHHLVARLVHDGRVDGLRVDHVDGLADPAGYCERLRELAPDAWLVVEKVLAPGEALRSWPVDGTTGYDLAALTTPFLVDPRGEAALTEGYAALTGDSLGWEEHAVQAKEEVLRSALGSDVARLTQLLVEVCERRRRFRDFTRTELREALIAVAAHTQAYRSYMRWTATGEAIRTPEDSAFVRHAIGAARAARPLLDPEVFDLLQLVLGFGAIGAAEQELAARFQQLTGPAMAKGEEDTALYRACRLLALDDVGHDPGTFSRGPDDVHAWAGKVAVAWPRTMLTTSTHDTKRSEDVRARLAVLAEIPEEVVELSSRVCARAATRFELDGHTAWFMVQTLIGAWPATRERFLGALVKSYREAQLRTSWLHPNDAYEQRVAALLHDLLADPVLSRAMERVVDLVRRPGQANSLALTTLRCTLPGVPDTYQGCDRWQLTLVDPDNRRAIDLAAHHALLRARAGRTPAGSWAEQSDDRSTSGPDDGAVKQALLRELLHLRGRGTWACGPYEPLTVTAAAADPAPALAYQRGDDLIVVVPRFPLRGAAAQEAATLELPVGPWQDVCTGELVEGGRMVTVASLTSRFPVAVLERTK